MTIVFATALALAGFAALFNSARPRLRIPAAVLCYSAAGWTIVAGIRLNETQESRISLMILFFFVALTAACAYSTVRILMNYEAYFPWWQIVFMAVTPVVIIVFAWFGIGMSALEDWRSSPIYLAQALYIYGHFGAMVIILAKRQRDPSLRIRIAVTATQTLVVLAMITEASYPQYTQFVAAILVLLAAWAVRWPEIWWQAPVDANDLLDSIGVFFFVLDDQGRVRKWNTSAAQLVEAIAPRTPLQRGIYLEKVLGTTIPERDGAILDFSVGGGVLRIECQSHTVQTSQNLTERVVMLKPLSSRVNYSKLAAPSGELAGYDPTTQTLSRRSTLERLQSTAVAVRLEFRPTIKSVLVDEVMFVVARRLEASFPSIEWGRIDSWSFIALMDNEHDADFLAESLLTSEGQPVDDGLAVYSNVYVYVRESDEGGRVFARRVSQPRMNEDFDVDTQELKG